MQFTETFHGYIETTTDILLLIEACRHGILPVTNRRLFEKERSLIQSGTIIVFDESASGIKRWTDGFLWSPSRILGNFLIYRELKNRESRSTGPHCHDNIQHNPDSVLKERALVGSLTTSNTIYNFKENGLIKKTIRMIVNDKHLHIISYYNKNDVLNHRLTTPSASPRIGCLPISPDLMPHLSKNDTRKRTISFINEPKKRMYSPLIYSQPNSYFGNKLLTDASTTVDMFSYHQ
ncbi:Gti1/Pac2 family-domain-containing protein [Gilbertella persicaria]|uniref:Gti1/Pac2 family-domain-containing protein n=1 Tax=Gilbertella persicaria TaxID=101096 RepID=UPI00221F82A6|nr:Gti1/Pac2 family-domain-containing protein [Gilbertella persicaria]KAI8080098.1 Gti1/Pac2 family-domain-containing protein [Gilbertella persicaria]